ncbi:unnamed protein product [Nezara viridula]|uniref:Biogenesis of lysosome-related organelles complex 1 subunit 6 n=1 Tax=Nezara viridula TaxID=85310 RepID=A0A9P0HJT5_NEZVI|nr:unnamed protein product [Nezara viridula]
MEDDVSKKFSSGLLDHYEPPLKKIEKQLMDLTTRQCTTLTEIEAENVKFKSVDMSEVNNLFATVKEYQLRLMNVKKEMNHLTDKSFQLKKRALRIQEIKQREALQNAHYQEAQHKREQDLIARPNTKSRQGSNSNSKQ